MQGETEKTAGLHLFDYLNSGYDWPRQIYQGISDTHPVGVPCAFPILCVLFVLYNCIDISTGDDMHLGFLTPNHP